MAQTYKKSNWAKRFLRWLFGSPFQGLPSEFGDPVLPELRTFEAEVEEAQHRIQEVPSPPAIHSKQTVPVQRDDFPGARIKDK